MVIVYKKNERLEVRQGRPSTGLCSSVDSCILLKIKSYRIAHPKWSATTIRTELQISDGYSSDALPSIRTINRYLSLEQLTKKYEKNRPLTSEAHCKVSAAHECWQMDDKGSEYYEGVGHIGMINVKDVQSSAYIQSFAVPLPHTRSHPTMSDYQCALRLTFMEFGLPQRIQADHGSNFYENRSKSPFPTPLHLWLLGMGIHLTWARIYRPTDQAQVERSHQTVHDQMFCTNAYKNIDHFQQKLNERRQRLNYDLPSQTHQGKAPLQAIPEAQHSKRFYNPSNETQLFDNQNIIKYLVGKEWFRKISANKTVSLGGHIYYLPKTKVNTEVKIVLEVKSDTKTKTQTNHLLFFNVNELLASIPIKGLDFDTLAGKDFMKTLKGNQLEIPFEHNFLIQKYTSLCPF
jgi:hypothetical protein